MKIRTLLVIVLCLCASVANAQPQQSSGALNTATVVFSATAGADWLTTHRALSNGMRETNPTLTMLKNRPTPTVIVGMAQDVVTVWAVRKVGKRHPKLGTVTFYGLSAFRGFLAYRNYNRLQTQKQINDRIGM